MAKRRRSNADVAKVILDVLYRCGPKSKSFLVYYMNRYHCIPINEIKSNISQLRRDGIIRYAKCGFIPLVTVDELDTLRQKG